MALTRVDTLNGPGLIDPEFVEGVHPFTKKGKATPPQLKLLLRSGGAFYMLHSRSNAIAVFGPDEAALIEPPKGKEPKARKSKATVGTAAADTEE